jgi:hypothetical protein
MKIKTLVKPEKSNFKLGGAIDNIKLNAIKTNKNTIEKQC